MNISTYLSRREALVASAADRINIWEKDDLLVKFNFVSAGLTNFLPDISHNKHEAIFKDILLHQRLSVLEQEFFGMLDYVHYENLTPDAWKALRSPAVICTFHTGSYRLINQFLAKNSIPYSLVISRDVLQQQGTSIQQLYAAFYSGPRYEELKLIDAEAPSSGLQMIKELKRGKSLLIYIDGNTGASGPTSHNENSCEIQFLGGALFARKGLGFMAHAAKVPVLNVICSRPSLDQIKLRFIDPVYPDPAEDRTAFALRTTQQLYDDAAPVIAAYPGQWEAWTYLHKVVSVKTGSRPLAVSGDTEGPALLHFNRAGFGIFKISKDYFLFDKHHYASYPVTANTYAFLYNALQQPVRKEDIDPLLFQQLYDKQVLLSEIA